MTPGAKATSSSSSSRSPNTRDFTTRSALHPRGAAFFLGDTSQARKPARMQVNPGTARELACLACSSSCRSSNMLPEDPDLLSRGHYRRQFMARPKASRRQRPVISVSDYLRAAYAPTPYVSCQRRRDSRPAWRSKSRPVVRGCADMQRGPIGPLCMLAAKLLPYYRRVISPVSGSTTSASGRTSASVGTGFRCRTDCVSR